MVEPRLKRDLHVELARRELTLKAWFVDQATRFLETSRQPPLFAAEDITSTKPQVPSDAPSPAKADTD